MRLGFVIFPISFARSRRVEVAQRGKLQAIRTIVAFQEPFHAEFGPAVRVFGPLGTLFRNRHFCRLAIRRASGRENHDPNFRSDQRAHQRSPLSHIIFEIFCRLSNRLTHRRQRGEMNTSLESMLFRDTLQKS